MSTRGNYVFVDYPIKETENGDWVRAPEQIVELKKGISNDNEIIKRGFKIYVHWDNYPSGALPRLFQFLKLKGAEGRAYDPSYLSAWFVTYNCCLNNDWELKPFDLENHHSFTGIGLENNLNDWCDYTYVILYDSQGFRIFIYDWEFNFIDEVHTTDDLEELKNEEWWY